MAEPTSPVLIRHLAAKNFLSFDPNNAGIELLALTVFIGANGCGKSNFLEAINLMRSAPKQFRDVTRKGGGVAEWIWKGLPKEEASVEWVLHYPKGAKSLRHTVIFSAVAQSFSLEDERVENAEIQPPNVEDNWNPALLLRPLTVSACALCFVGATSAMMSA